MQVQFGKMIFNKTQHENLSGKVVTIFESEDGKFHGQCDAGTFKMNVEFSGTEHKDLISAADTIGLLTDAVYQEHSRLRKGVRDQLMGRG